MKKKSTSQFAPIRRSFGEGGFFNLRVLIGLFVFFAGVLLALLGFGTFSDASAQANVGSASLAGQGQEPTTQQVGQTTVISTVHSDLSPPLREQPVVWPQAREKREPHAHPRIPFKHHDRPDPVIQSGFGQASMVTPAVPAPIRQWAGMGEPCNGCSPGPPPDTNGAVGKTQYVEMVNEALQVFEKLTGTSLLGPIPIKSVWSGFGGICYIGGDGDPIVVYDRLADRWVISQFATPSGAETSQDECIAVSMTGDATGAWYRYHFHLSNRFQDYPKFGVWPDGYYMSSNIYGSSPGEDEPSYLGPQPFVFDRAKMLVGDPTAKVQTRGLIGFKSEAPFLPSDLDGILPPPLGEPNHFVQSPVEVPEPPDVTNLNGPPRGAQLTATATSLAMPTTQPALTYKIWDFHVDWKHPANSRFSRKATVPAEDFALLCPEEPKDGNCVPQRGTKNVLDNIPGKLMFRNAYRRFADGRESMLNNFTVKARSVAGIRWFELARASRGHWTLRQEKTYQPDNTWRWMGSIASDNQGNIALGFSASSATIYPQIRYAGRLATDPLGVLSGEKHLFEGTGSQVANPIKPHSWGDYSDMTVDPVDDCTFYYTNEYYQTTGGKLRTRIGYFRFVQCTPPQKGAARFIVCDQGAPRSKALVSIDGMTYGAALADGTYDAVLPPGSHRYAASSPAFATQRGEFAIANGRTTLVKVCPARP